MLKKSLFVVAAVALLAATAQAGEVKTHSWPTSYVAVEVADIPVVMDIGYWVSILDQDDLKIELQQQDIHTYEGCCDITIECNFNLKLSCSITSTGAVPGDYGCSITGAEIDSPGGSATVCATLTDANLKGTTEISGGMDDVRVATVTVKVVPR
jgi:hypothetical protein